MIYQLDETNAFSTMKFWNDFLNLLLYPQLPVILNLLARVGAIDSQYLKERRKYFIVIIFAVAAVITPPDPITQIGLAIPLLILYELSILSVKLTERKNNA